MKGEFNELAYNNTNITFDPKPNNVATSDELMASPIYERTMGTNYSRGKKIQKAITAAGIALLVTAASIRAGTIVTNGFVLNPPKLANDTFSFSEGSFHYKFDIINKQNYTVTYNVTIDGVLKFSEDCTEETTYEGSFSEIEDGQKGLFYVEFTNRTDYKKKIRQVRFTTKGISL